MVSTQRPVLFRTAAELAEGHDDDPVSQLRGGEIVEKRAQGTRELTQNTRMCRQLDRVRVVTGLDYVINSGWRPRLDRARHEIEPSRQLGCGISGRPESASRSRGFELGGGGVSAGDGSVHERR